MILIAKITKKGNMTQKNQILNKMSQLSSILLTLNSEMNTNELEGMLCPRFDYDALKEQCQELRNDISKQFLVGRSLLDGRNDFFININLPSIKIVQR